MWFDSTLRLYEKKRTKPRPILSKIKRQGPTLDEMEAAEWQDYLDDCERKEREKIGPSNEVKKLLEKRGV